MGMGMEAESMKAPRSTPQGPRGMRECWRKAVKWVQRRFRRVHPFVDEMREMGRAG